MIKIKFRAWDTKAKKFMGERFILETPIWSLSADKSIYIYQQFTGLKDRKGKDIYSGDLLKNIVTYPSDSSIGKKLNGFIGQVYFDVSLGGWYITDIPEDEAEHQATLQRATLKDYEIVGNIYENKELLK